MLVGDNDVGKSCLLNGFKGLPFKESYISTIGVEMSTKTLVIGDSIVKLQLWDTAGARRFRTITSLYYKGAGAKMFFYDITNRESFDALEEFFTLSQQNGDAACMLVGNKMDLEEKRQVSTEEGQAWATKHEMKFMETSAKGQINIESAFVGLTRVALENFWL